MPNNLHPQDILNAYNVIFGPVVGVSIDNIIEIPPVILKTAYRKKAFETHPDRCLVVGKMQNELNKQFIELNLAYETLQTAIKNSSAIVKNSNNNVKHSNNTFNNGEIKKKADFKNNNSTAGDHFYKGIIPNRKLLIGQFLYYSGIISWKTLIDAIARQKMQRPSVGQIALQWGILSKKDIHVILKQRSLERKFDKRFVEYACMKGYLTSFQRLALLGKQSSLQRPIGTFFVEKGILMPNHIEIMVKRLQAHNRKASLNSF